MAGQRRPLKTIASVRSTKPSAAGELVAAAREHRAVDCSSHLWKRCRSAADRRSRRRRRAAGGHGATRATSPDCSARILWPRSRAARSKGLADPLLRERHSIALRRLVHRHHSVYENLAALAAAHGHTVSASPSVSILMATNRPEMVTFAIEQMAAQDYPNVEILCGLHGVLSAGGDTRTVCSRSRRTRSCSRLGPIATLARSWRC